MGSSGRALSGLRLLLDEHISPRVALALRRRGIDAAALREWREGTFLGQGDEDILAAALAEGRALVTYDLRTIPPLLRRLAEAGLSHAGVILVSAKGFPHGDTRRLARALGRLPEQHRGGLRNQVLFLLK